MLSQELMAAWEEYYDDLEIETANLQLTAIYNEIHNISFEVA